MATSNLDIGLELEKIRSEYGEALKISGHRCIPVYYIININRLENMQSTLLEIIELRKNPTTEEETEQANLAAVLYNGVSSIINSISDF